MKAAVFLDRDGTLNREVHYLSDAARFLLLPGAGEAVRRLNEAGLPVVVVTNQSGLARGYFDEAMLAAIHAEMADQLAAMGARVDAVVVCPHHPDDGCLCRKPHPAMLRQAAVELGLDLSASYLVGDKLSDIGAGQAAECRTALVLTGHGAAAQAELRAGGGPRPDVIVADLGQAVAWALEQTAGGQTSQGVRQAAPTRSGDDR